MERDLIMGHYMSAFDNTLRFNQVSQTIAYTEIVYLLDFDKYLVLWHDRIIGEFSTKGEALVKYNAIVREVRDENT